MAALSVSLPAGLIADSIHAGWRWPMLALGAVLAGIAYARPAFVGGAYRAWFSMTEQYMRLARWTLKAICFFVLFVIVGRGGSTLPLRRHADGSKWGERKSLSRDEFHHEYESKAEQGPSRRWSSAYMRWAKESGNGWVVLLLPFLALLACFDNREEAEVPQNIYTLF